MDLFSSPFGELKLARWPLRKNETLQAWDAADALLLEHLAEQNLPKTNAENTPKLLIVNDAFGALSCALRDHHLVNWSDSCISHFAAQENSALNAGEGESTASAKQVKLTSMESPEGLFDLVLIKIPKTTALLEDQLIRLRPHLHKDSVIIAAGMIKHLQKSAFQCFEKNIGSLTTSLAKKKARLIFVTLDEALPQVESPYPTSYEESEISLTLSNHANVFSRDHLDLGARFFLKQFAEVPAVERAVDLACGNGVLGIKYQQQAPGAKIQFIDESYMAVASAQDNYQTVFPDKGTATFAVADGLNQTDSDSVDLILCNPPFHQQHVIGEQIALGMFRDSKRCLAQGGELWVVANRHLPYAAKLKLLFGNCRTVATNKSFAVYRVVKR